MLRQQEAFINYALQMDDFRWELIKIKEQIEQKNSSNEELVEITERLANVSENLISCYQKIGNYKEGSWHDRTPTSLSMELIELNLKEIAKRLS